MPYVRVSIMKPMEGREQGVEEINRQLADFYRQQPGCIQSSFMKSNDGSGDMGRVSFWKSEEEADHAAVLSTSMALRSQLHLMIRAGHQDRSFITE